MFRNFINNFKLNILTIIIPPYTEPITPSVTTPIDDDLFFDYPTPIPYSLYLSYESLDI